MQDVLLTCVLLATIGCLYYRPFGARDWHVAGTGALIAWVIGPLGVNGGIEVIADSGNIVAFFLGLMVIAAAAEAAGLYARAAELLGRRHGARTRVAAVILVGIGITAVLSNDATPLILTPAIFAAGAVNSPGRRQAALAATFTADGASLLLPVSNPVNLLFFERFDMGSGYYLSTITPAAMAGIAAMALVIVLRTPRSPAAEAEAAAPFPRRRAWPALAVVGSLAIAYVAAGVAGVPLGIVALGGGVVMLTVVRLSGPLDSGHLRRFVSPGVLVFVAALLLLIESVSAAGVLEPLSSMLGWLSNRPALVSILGTAVLAAVLSNLINNWPAALVLAVAIGSVSAGQEQLVAGALIGAALGANFTMIGSLSTVFWLTLARQSGANFGAGEYAKAALLPTAAGLAAACCVAALLV